jgi:hypothetical protein
VTALLRNVAGAFGAVAKVAERIAAIGVLVAAGWHDDDPVPYDPLIS